ncbi:benzoate carboxyl methyltransferase [Fusarium heterosporum]|uniref:Benzoate carboxyl methyltransferase n=1 Tax=Fusarium heterosporum TaxID=42747 RepID=A0A8H5TPS5_FUSHE|nr:benzoate carboxyl methyltransferase [Fusarium heterosporum]
MSESQGDVRIAMRDKHYNEKCEIQHAAMRAGLDLIPVFTALVIDYGCAQGANSIEPIKKVISTLPDGATASLVFEDTPFNDFGSLAKTVSHHFTNTDAKIFVAPSLVPLGFYQQVVPSNYVDVGFSWSSFNYLERTPSISLDATVSPVDFAVARHKALASAAHIDLIKLLKLRAKEIREEGYLIAAIGGQKPGGETRPSNPGGHVMQAATMRMVGEGKLSVPELMQLALFPSHERTPDEVRAALEDEAVAPLWEVEVLESKLIVQPAWEVFQNTLQNDETKKEEALQKYARTVMENLVAASGWFWIDVLKTSRGENWDGGDAFLEDFIDIAVDEFVTKHADFKAEIWYNYLRLRRTGNKA